MTVYLSHATSFCAGVWDPVRAALPGIDTVAWDQPGHGAGPALDPPVAWESFGAYVLEVTEPGGIGVGHSMGAAALAMAQIADPGRFRAMVLVEPVIYPGPYTRHDNEMSDRAGRRRKVFGSRGEAADHFRGRGAFTGWVEEALQGYVRDGLIGDGPVHLACDPEVEADIYRGSGAHQTWDHLQAIDIPVLVMSGAESDTVTPELAHEQAGRLVRGGVEVVPGAGHFLPMENPRLVAERVRRLVEAVGAD